MPAASESGDVEPGTNNEVKRESYQRRQRQSQPKEDYAMSEELQKSVETFGTEQATRHQGICSQNAGADATSLDGKRSQESSRSTGFIGMITGAVGAMIPGKARQKDERSAGKQRRPPTPTSHEPTGKLQDQARHKVNRPQEQVPGPQTKETESDGPLESRRRMGGNEEQEAARLRDQLHRVQEKAKQETSTLLEQVHSLQLKSKQDARKLQQMSMEANTMKSIVCTLQDDLQKAKTRVAALGRTVAENEVIITQANATAVSRLASNVSRDFTDDVIKETLRKFFQTDFFSWCADLCAEKIEDETAALRKLLEAGIINANRDHLDGPEYLIFKINTPDGSGPLMLLQAALATRLCDLYLADPYFLAQELPTNLQDRWMLPRLEHIFSHAALDAAINWRVQTVECLEQAVPITESYVTREVHRFVQEYGFLLSTDQFDHEAGKDLARIFANFAGLALKLWKSRAHVCCCGIRGFGEAAFDLGNPLIEVDSSLASSMGQRLNGRPIGLIIRPAIWANSLSQDGTVEQVVWLKALAWVSGEEGDMDLMELA